MKIKELLNKLNEIVNENPTMLESKIIIQADADHIYTVDIDEVNVVDGQIVLEGEW